MRLYLRLIKFIRPYLANFILAVVCMILYTVFSGFSLMTLLPIVDGVLGGKQMTFNSTVSFPFKPQLLHLLDVLNGMDRLWLLNASVIFFVVVIFLKVFFDYCQQVLMEKVGQSAMRDVRCEVYEHMVRKLSMEYFARERVGALMTRVTNDVNILLELLSGRFASTLNDSMQLFVYLSIILVIDWKLALSALLVMPFAMIPILRLGKLVRKLSKASQEKVADVGSILHETISGIRIVKAFGMEDYEAGRFRKESSIFAKIMIRSAKREAFLGPLTEFVGVVLAAFVVYVGARRVLLGTMTLGEFVLFLGALVSMMKPVKVAAKLNITLQKSRAAGERVYEILDTVSTVVEKHNAGVMQPLAQAIVFHSVSFGYKPSHPILRDVSLEVKAGEVVAFVGPSGVGKTSLLNLLPRFYDPTGGKITIDGVDIRDYSLRSLRAQMGIVTQETILFNDSIRNNISYGVGETSLEKVIEAAKAANIHDAVMKFEHGYESIIGERGMRLSGGERQRIAIARALLKNPKILILDEATSALDMESERLVQQALDNLMAQRTVLIIAHRLSTIQHADRIVVLENGRVLESGRHEELLKNGILYKKLYELQFAAIV